MPTTLSVMQQGAAAAGGTRSARSYQELWFALARRPWSSVVLVPADPDGSTVEMAKSLADVGKQLSTDPISAITAESLEYGSALALVDLQQSAARERTGFRASAITVTARRVSSAEEPIVASESEPGLTVLPPTSRVIIAVPPIVAEPLGLAAVQRADVVVISIRMGHTRLKDARRTIDLIGRERIAGCFLVA